MTEEMTNLVLEQLRRIRGSVEHIEEEVADVKLLRLSAVEQGLGNVQIATGQLQVTVSS